MIKEERLRFNGKRAWFVTPENKYGLSKYPLRNITNSSFTFLVKTKIYWDAMENGKECGIVIKNGKHLGLSALKSEDAEHLYAKGTIWTIMGDGSIKNWDILFKLNWEDSDKDKEYNLAFSVNLKLKKFFVYCDGKTSEMEFEGDLVDYTTSWLWVGASNPLDSCPDEFKNFFYGEIVNAAIYSTPLISYEIDKIYSDLETNFTTYNPVCFFNFRNRTPYKILDITHTGNNLIKFDTRWMDSI
jgi:hypothetical protein